jgi:hypothetical protein
MTNWLKRLFGGSDSESDSSATTAPAAPATPPEPSVTPSEPAETGPADSGRGEQAPAGDEPA